MNPAEWKYDEKNKAWHKSIKAVGVGLSAIRVAVVQKPSTYPDTFECYVDGTCAGIFRNNADAAKAHCDLVIWNFLTQALEQYIGAPLRTVSHKRGRTSLVFGHSEKERQNDGSN